MDFSEYIAERTQFFTGREWVFEKINTWLSANNSRIFLLAGRPGTGKTAIAARLTQISDGTVTVSSAPLLTSGWLTYSHFCQAGLEGTLSPLDFVASISESLANRYPVFRDALEKAALSQIVINQNITTAATGANITGAKIKVEIKTGDARPLFDQAVRIPLNKLCVPSFKESIVILVDSLDEALTFNPAVNITQLMKLVNDFPPQVRFVLTCRSNSDRVFKLLRQQPTLDLLANAENKEDEVEIYANARLTGLAADGPRSQLAHRIAEQSGGNFLYAFHVLNDVIAGGNIENSNAIVLPEKLDDVYRKFIEREMASDETKWNDVYRPLLGPIAVALGEGLTRSQLIGITDLPEDTTDDVLKVCSQYLVGGVPATQPYRIYHQSFRDFLLNDEDYSVFPAARHEAIAEYFQNECGSNWTGCRDNYGLRYTPAHWADSATLSDSRREGRTQSLVSLTSNESYQTAFETQVGDLPALQDYLHRAVKVAALNSRADMLLWLVRAAKQFGRFRDNYLKGESVVALAQQGEIRQAEKRLALFTDLEEDWKTAARMIIGWLGTDRNKAVAEEVRDEVGGSLSQGQPVEALLILRARFEAALNDQPLFPCDENQPLSLDVGREVVKRLSGQAFDQELLKSVDPSFITNLGQQSELLNNAKYGYASNLDGPILVQMARVYGDEGTELVDSYIDAHAGYNYIEYRNRSLWMVLHSVLRNHPDQNWVKERLRRLLVGALSGGGVDFEEMLPMTAALLAEKAAQRAPGLLLDQWRADAAAKAAELQYNRKHNDSWGNHKRRLTALMELYHFVLSDSNGVDELKKSLSRLPFGFAGFQAPANLRLSEAFLVCGQTAWVDGAIDQSLRSAHNIQDYHFCARITARCNALKQWHSQSLTGQNLVKAINSFVTSPSDPEFAARHRVHDLYDYRDKNDDSLSVGPARAAATLEQLVDVFQRPAVEFRRLNPDFGLKDILKEGTPVLIPDPGLAPLLAIHFAAATLADASLKGQRASLIQALVPMAVANPTALDTVLSYLLIAVAPNDAKLMTEITKEIGPVEPLDFAPPASDIGYRSPPPLPR
ncbi:MAG TPA: hypothetical protein VN659_02010 [Pyrinomonadaceae bacterium]|nr:hypothetical protein [Pyrinomonadaceae bacterium]